MARRKRHLVRRLTDAAAPLEAAYRALPDRWARRLLPLIRRSTSSVGRFNRYIYLRARAAACGEVVDVRDNVYLFSVGRLTIGSYVSIHPMTYIDATGGVEIGSNVSIAHGVTVMSSEHQFDAPHLPIREQPVELLRTVIGDDVWIGAGARVLAGAHIGDGTVVAAGAVVTKSTPPGSVVGGVPARLIRERRRPRPE